MDLSKLTKSALINHAKLEGIALKWADTRSREILIARIESETSKRQVEDNEADYNQDFLDDGNYQRDQADDGAIEETTEIGAFTEDHKAFLKLFEESEPYRPEDADEPDPRDGDRMVPSEELAEFPARDFTEDPEIEVDVCVGADEPEDFNDPGIGATIEICFGADHIVEALTEHGEGVFASFGIELGEDEPTDLAEAIQTAADRVRAMETELRAKLAPKQDGEPVKRGRGRPKGVKDSKPRLPHGERALLRALAPKRPVGRPKGSRDSQPRAKREADFSWLLNAKPVHSFTRAAQTGSLVNLLSL